MLGSSPSPWTNGEGVLGLPLCHGVAGEDCLRYSQPLLPDPSLNTLNPTLAKVPLCVRERPGQGWEAESWSISPEILDSQRSREPILPFYE